MLIPISKGCEILGVSRSTVYQMLKRGVLKESFRTEEKHRRFNSPPYSRRVFYSPPFGPRVFYVHDIHQLQRKTYEPRVVTYARVSSHDQKQDLVRQSTILSGLNYKKNGFVKLLDLIFNHEFEILIVNHKDRLLRFGVELIDKICLRHGVKRIVLEDKTIPFEEELTRDVIELMTVFCARLYGKRSHKNKLKFVSI